MQIAVIISAVFGGLILLISLLSCLIFAVRRNKRKPTKNEFRDFSRYGNQTNMAGQTGYNYNKSQEVGGNFVSRKQTNRYNASPYGFGVVQEGGDFDVDNYNDGSFPQSAQTAPVVWQTSYLPPSNNPYALGNTVYPQNFATSYVPGYVRNVSEKKGKKKKNKGYSSSSSESEDDNVVVARKWIGQQKRYDTSSTSSDSEDEVQRRKSKKKMKKNKGVNQMAVFEAPSQALSTPQAVFQPPQQKVVYQPQQKVIYQPQQTASQPQVLNASNLPKIIQIPSAQTQPSAYVINIPNQQEEQQETRISYEAQPAVKQYNITGSSVFTPHQTGLPKPYENQVKSVNIDGGCGLNGGIIAPRVITSGVAAGNIYTTNGFDNQGFDMVETSNGFQNNVGQVFGGIMTKHSAQPFQTYSPFLNQKPLFFQAP